MIDDTLLISHWSCFKNKVDQVFQFRQQQANFLYLQLATNFFYSLDISSSSITLINFVPSQLQLSYCRTSLNYKVQIIQILGIDDSHPKALSKKCRPNKRANGSIINYKMKYDPFPKGGPTPISRRTSISHFSNTMDGCRKNRKLR